MDQKFRQANDCTENSTESIQCLNETLKCEFTKTYRVLLCVHEPILGL